MVTRPVNEATWSNSEGETSEIDHVLVAQEASGHWGKAEARPGVSVLDHRTVWVQFTGCQVEDEEGEKRAVGENWEAITKEGWRAYAAALAGQAGRIGVNVAAPAKTMRAIQEATLRAGRAERKKAMGGKGSDGAVTYVNDGEAASAAAGERKEKPKTRAEHLNEIERWQSALDAAHDWGGRGKLRALGSVGRWLKERECGAHFEKDTAGAGAEARKEALEALCEAGREIAMAEATSVTGAAWDEDEISHAISEAMGPEGGGTGGVQKKLFEILNGAKGGANGGGAKLMSIYEWDDKEGRELRQAEQVREHAREMGEHINKAAPVAMGVVKKIMALGGEPARPPAAKRGDWVDDVCTWERFQEGLERTEARKVVGCDGWNAYLLKRAPEELQRAYWRAMQAAARRRLFPEEWGKKVAMLFMKPGEDPSELGRRRDIWLECHGLKLMMWLLGNEYERAAEENIPVSQSGNVKERGCPEQSLTMR